MSDREIVKELEKILKTNDVVGKVKKLLDTLRE